MHLLDDSPVVPGDTRPAYANAHQARQVLNDAEDDLRDWQPETENYADAAESEPMQKGKTKDAEEEEEEEIAEAGEAGKAAALAT